MRTWQLQTAKAQLSELLRRAKAEGPQEITVRGKEAFVVLTREEFEREGRRPRRRTGDGKSLWEALQRSPLKGLDINFDELRDKSPPRDIEL